MLVVHCTYVVDETKASNLLDSDSPLKQEEYAWLNYKLCIHTWWFQRSLECLSQEPWGKGIQFVCKLIFSIVCEGKTPPFGVLGSQTLRRQKKLGRWSSVGRPRMLMWNLGVCLWWVAEVKRGLGKWNPPARMSQLSVHHHGVWHFLGMGLDLNPFWIFFFTDCRSGVTSSALAADVENCMSKSIQPQLGIMMKLQVPLSPIPSMVAWYIHLHEWLMFIYVYGKRYTWILYSTTISGFSGGLPNHLQLDKKPKGTY